MTSHEATLAVWAALGIVVVLLQAGAIASRGRFPGLGSAVKVLTARPVGRVLMVLAWMFLGWHAFAR